MLVVAGVGVDGYTNSDRNDLPAINGNAPKGTGVAGSGHRNGVYGKTDTGTGAGLRGESAQGRGGIFAGAAAQVKLVPAAAAAPPMDGEQGDLFVDSSGGLWFCTATGNPATWKRVVLQ